MTPFVTVSDETVAETICQATKRLVYIAPGVGVASAKALVQWSRRPTNDRVGFRP